MKYAYIFFKFSLVFFLPISVIYSNVEISSNQKELLENIPPDQRDSILEKMNKSSELEDELNEIFTEESTLVKRRDKEELSAEDECKECIFGYDFFKYSPITEKPVF